MSDAPRPVQRVAEPDLAALLAAHRAEIFSSLNCHQWGTIQSFDADKQTATVQIAALRLVPTSQGGKPIYVPRAYPVLQDVPVMILAGGDGRLTFPIAAGDLCLVLFNDRDFDAFWATGTVSGPNSQRMHDLSDGLAIIGFRTKAAPISDFFEDGAELRFGDSFLQLTDKVNLASSLTDLKTTLNAVLTALTALNGKTGPSAATQIAAAQTQVDNLTQ